MVHGILIALPQFHYNLPKSSKQCAQGVPMDNSQLTTGELFRRAFLTAPGVMRLLGVVFFTIFVGIALSLSDAPSSIITWAIIGVAILAGNVIFFPVYIKWRRETK